MYQNRFRGGRDVRFLAPGCRVRLVRLWLYAAVALVTVVPLHAQEQKLPARADFEQKLGSRIPLDLPFTDETGRQVTLGTLFGRHPVILQLGYNRCWLLCDVVTGALVRSLQDLKLNPGSDFDVVFASIDPAETWQLSARKKAEYVRSYGRLNTGPGWHFLTGSEPAISALAAATGFHYFYDPASRQFAHPSGIVVVTPQGRVSKYFYGVEFDPPKLRGALVEASGGAIGSPVERLLLLCYHWNPLVGKYGLLIAWGLKAGCFGTCALLGGFIAVWLWRERRQRRLEANPAP
jgi:protein SCO1/2